MIFSGKLMKIGEELVADGPLAENVKPFTEQDRFPGDQAQGVADQLAVGITGFGTAPDQMAVIDKLNSGMFMADDLDQGCFGRYGREGFPENGAGLQLLQDRLSAVVVRGHDDCFSLQHNPHQLAAAAEGGDGLARLVGTLHGVEADHHPLIVLFADAIKK